jgi:hypothetical protein
VKFRLQKINNHETPMIVQEQHIQTIKNLEEIIYSEIVLVEEGHIGVEFCSMIDNNALVVKTILSDGLLKAVDNESKIHVGDILCAVNGQEILVGDGPWIQSSYEYLQKNGGLRPLTLSFARPYLVKTTVNKEDCKLDNDGPEEFVLTEKKFDGKLNRICLSSFRDIDGAAESSGVFIGDNLIFINEIPVGAGTKLRPGCPIIGLQDIQAILKDDSSYPMCLQFARQSSSSGKRKVDFDLESDDIKTSTVTVDHPSLLGFVIREMRVGSSNSYIVAEFHAVEGTFKRIVSHSVFASKIDDLSVYSINGEALPSYASCDMVMSAMKRGWKNGQKIEMVFCDEMIKNKVLSAGVIVESPPS